MKTETNIKIRILQKKEYFYRSINNNKKKLKELKKAANSFPAAHELYLNPLNDGHVTDHVHIYVLFTYIQNCLNRTVKIFSIVGKTLALWTLKRYLCLSFSCTELTGREFQG